MIDAEVLGYREPPFISRGLNDLYRNGGVYDTQRPSPRNPYEPISPETFFGLRPRSSRPQVDAPASSPSASSPPAPFSQNDLYRNDRLYSTRNAPPLNSQPISPETFYGGLHPRSPRPQVDAPASSPSASSPPAPFSRNDLYRNDRPYSTRNPPPLRQTVQRSDPSSSERLFEPAPLICAHCPRCFETQERLDTHTLSAHRQFSSWGQSCVIC